MNEDGDVLVDQRNKAWAYEVSDKTDAEISFADAVASIPDDGPKMEQ